MNLDQVEKIADAVLYEGYMLYPYRPSSIKNRQRWNFGVLYPASFCEGQTGPDACSMRTECLLDATADTRLTVKVRFLQLVQRSIGKLRKPGQEEAAGVEPDMEFVDRLELDGRLYQPWQEALEREQTYTGLEPAALSSSSPPAFTYPGGKSFEYLHDSQGKAAGAIVREWKTLNGSVQFDSKQLREGVTKLTVRVDNNCPDDADLPVGNANREAALMYSLVSAHTILGAEQGDFLSLLEPPAGLEDLAAQCESAGTWPVLAGDGAKAILSSPIILYDYPKIAPESAGNLFDATEIDEILSLRILTLTDEEKREMRDSDPRAQAILERTENMPEEQFLKLHGALRGLRPKEEELR